MRIVLLAPHNSIKPSLLLIKRIFTSACFFLASFTWAEPEVISTSKDINTLDDIVIVGEKDEQFVLEQSAAAVDVIDLISDQRLTADLSEVLSREPGISIRRMGGLGSRESFALNGLQDEQIRFFIDGIPLEMSGYTFGISSIPVNLIQRAEIYHGVVPIEFGSDALGGAVNLVTDKGKDGTSGSVSYMQGNFNTQRSALNLKYVDENSGFFSRLNGFYDYSDNDYEVDVTIPNRLAQIVPYKAKRFHNAYEGKGINFDLGYTEKAWADLVQLSLYTSEYYSEIQHNVTMSIVYGEPTIERKTSGANLLYQQQFIDSLSLSLATGISETNSEFIDTADYSYLWNGKEVITPATHPGEIADPCDCTYWRTNKFSIMHLQWDLAQGDLIELSVAPTWNEQSAKNDYLDDGIVDVIDADRKLFSFVSGASYTLDLFSEKLQNELFIKHYRQTRNSDEPDDILELKRELDSSTDRVGWGNAIRYSFYDWLLAKASYEQATRLPEFHEIFGNAENIIPNVDLTEEYSNNYNASIKITELPTQYGSWNSELNFFLREIEDQILLTTINNVSQYDNIAAADSSGYQLSSAWSSPEDFINISANYTSFDLINKADTGPYSPYRNQKIPNHPHTFYNTKLTLKWLGILSGYDEFDVQWNYRHVDEFETIWENLGKPPTVKSQDSHSLAATYSKDFFPYTVTFTAEVQNLTDEKLFDHYGVQKPGRAYYFKTIFEF